MIPINKKISYGRLVCDIREQKQEKERTRLTVGGDKLEYEGPVTTETADLTTAKVLFNSTISTPNARFIFFDIHLPCDFLSMGVYDRNYPCACMT